MSWSAALALALVLVSAMGFILAVPGHAISAGAETLSDQDASGSQESASQESDRGGVLPDASSQDAASSDEVAGENSAAVAADNDQQDTSPAEALAAPANGLLAMASRVDSANKPQVTEFAIYDKAPGNGGKMLYDLLKGDDVPRLKSETEYYLSIQVTKSYVLDENWVSITLPWWVSPVNTVGGNKWNQPGASIASLNTSLDSVLNWVPNAGRPSQGATETGTVTYSIKAGDSDVKVAGILMSFRPSQNYLNADETETFVQDAAQFKVATGRLGENNAIGEQTDSHSTSKLEFIGTGKFFSYGGNNTVPDLGIGASGRAFNFHWVAASYYGVWRHIEFDVVQNPSQIASYTNLKFFGWEPELTSETTDDQGVITRHYVVDKPEGVRYKGEIGISADATVANDSSLIGKRVGLPIRNIEITMWGDEKPAPIKGSTTLQYNVVGTDPVVTLSAQSWGTRYNWNMQENIHQSTRLASADLGTKGAVKGNQTAPYTVEITPADNVKVTSFTVPLYDGHATTITVNG
ncbi:MAG: hypothetical protein ACOX4F_06120 [Atopobiaceae bacterium]